MSIQCTIWLSNQIKNQVDHRDILKTKAIQIGSTSLPGIYKSKKNNVNNIKRDKTNYFTEKFNKPSNTLEHE